MEISKTMQKPSLVNVKKMAATLGELRCICPELHFDGTVLTSNGGSTSGGWKGRAADRKKGVDVPIGGCVCYMGDDIQFVLDQLIVIPES